jgi:peptidyl-prolyl cis-trans isomerase C
MTIAAGPQGTRSGLTNTHEMPRSRVTMRIGPKPVAILPPHASTPRGMVLLGLIMGGIALGGPVHATSPADSPTISPPTPPPKRSLFTNPAELLTTMANHLHQDPNTVVLTVENEPITQEDLANVIRSLPISMGTLGTGEVYRRGMEVLIRQKVMELKARELGLDKDPLVIEKGKIAFETILGEAWLNRQADAAITEKSLHARYDSEVAGKPGPEEVRARVILVPTEAEAQSLIEKARNGADFGDLARQFSKDPSASEGGDLGYLPLEAVSPEVGSAMFALAPGQVTPYPVNGLFGYFILRVEGRQRRATPTFDEARDRLEREIRGDAIRDAITSLLKEIKFTPGVKPAESPAQ